ncbi:MAG: hypothetical protein JNK30_15535 [Phenylobacterium sp.]|nr:hypothetical protein [Phenylobacterium sp.]MBL8772794.1 hypothetical protein [Phenylobacterium sp.]
MTTLDYATFFETQVRPRRRRRRLMLGLAAVMVWVLPVAYVGLMVGP